MEESYIWGAEGDIVMYITIGVLAFFVILWLINAIVLMSFAKSVGYGAGWLAIIPFGFFSMAVWCISMELAAPNGREAGKIMIKAVLGLIPIVNIFIMFYFLYLFFSTLHSFCKEYGKSMFLSLLFIILLPGIGQLIVMSGQKKAVMQQLATDDV